MLLCQYAVFILMFTYVVGVFELAPTEDVLVCPGEQLKVTCSTSVSMFLEWNITIPNFSLSETRAISSSNMALTVSPLEVNRVAFMFVITATSPLTSKLSINSTTVDLNGTIITCSERGTAADRRAEIFLHIIDMIIDIPAPPEVRIRSEQFGINNVTVIIEWIGADNTMSHDVSLTPESLSGVSFPGSTSSSVELELLYNIHYNLSVVASLCGRNNATTITTLHYANCGVPMITSGVILNYSSTLPGSQILFWCEEGLLPNTVIIAICTESAIWVPNPIEHSCSASSVDMFQTESTVATIETIRVATNWTVIGIAIALVLLIGVALLTVFVAAVTAFVKGSRSQRKNNVGVEHQEKDIEMSKNVVYDDVKNCRKQRFVLKENVSYCSSSDFSVRVSSNL